MIERYTLKNGLPVFIVENHAAPVVTIQAWVKRGSVYEPDKLAGISHFLEHSLFKGTSKRKVGQIALEIEACGGEINAFTSFEETVYYTTLGSRFVTKGMEILADAIQNPAFDPQEMAREREVILEEIKRSHDSPYRTVSKNLWKAFFPQSPYGRPVLGFESTVQKIDHKTLRTYFNQHYHAGSICLFIVGDINPSSVMSQCQDLFGKIPKKKNVTTPKVPPYFKGAKVKVTLEAKDIQECLIQIAWPAPPLIDEKTAVLDVLTTALGQGESSALYQYLVKDNQVALDVSMGLIATAKCGMIVLGLQAKPEMAEKTVDEALKFLRNIAERGLNESDVERVKSSLEADVIGSKETVEGYARRLGYYTMQFGDPGSEEQYLKSVLAVTSEDCSKALEQVLQYQPVLSAVHPLSSKPDLKGLSTHIKPQKVKTKNIKQKGSEVTLTKRSSVRFVEKHISHLPIISLKIIFPGGSRDEKESELGVGNLLQRVWTSGSRHYHSKQIAYALDSMGASLSGYVGRHTMGLTLEFLSKQWSSIKPLLTDLLLQPSFPEKEIETEKNLLLQDIRSERDMPAQVCQLNFQKLLYGSHHYGRSSLGTETTVTNLGAPQLRTFYQNFIHQGGVVAASVGNFEKNRWEMELSELLQQLPATGATPKKMEAPLSQRALQIALEVKQPLQQSHILIGFLGPGLKSKDRFALKLLHSCLSGQGGRLFVELRDKLSLAYTVAPLQVDNLEGGMFGVYMGCSPEKLATATHAIRAELEKVIAQNITSKELARAKQYLLGRIALDMQRFSSQAMVYGLDEMYGLGFDFSDHLDEQIKSISAETVRAAAEKYLCLDRAVISVVHNQQMESAFIRHSWEKGLPSSTGSQLKQKGT